MSTIVSWGASPSLIIGSAVVVFGFPVVWLGMLVKASGAATDLYYDDDGSAG
jgi:hypothetical protein